MSRRSDRALEEERAAILREMDAAERAGEPLGEPLRARIAAVVEADFDGVRASQSVDARRGQALASLFRDLFERSGIVDAKPASMTIVPLADGNELFVESYSRGRVSIGFIPYATARHLVADVLPLSRASASTVATDALEERTARRVRRTAELTAEGRTARQIGAIIASEEGASADFPVPTVRTWRGLAKRMRVADHPM